MTEPTCPACASLRAANADLRDEIKALRAQVATLTDALTRAEWVKMGVMINDEELPSQATPAEGGRTDYPTRFKTQTVTGNDGNCLAACIASILDCPLADVPDITGANEVGWGAKMAAFCASRGFSFATSASDCGPAGLSIGVGPSPRRPNVKHSVVCFDGLPIFDPHPDRTFFAGKPIKYFIEVAAAPTATRGEDTRRLDWLEAEANTRDGIHLHDGSHTGCNGLGLARLGRSLRDAIDAATPTGETSDA